MDKYSHGAFQITGYKVTIHNPEEEADITQSAWEKFQAEKMGETIVGKAFEGYHAVYFNYVHPTEPEKKGYDMVIGYMTLDDAVQTNQALTTVKVPAQDYRYTSVEADCFYNTARELTAKWKEIISMPASELARTFGYDLDMYNADGTKVTIAVSVTEPQE